MFYHDQTEAIWPSSTLLPLWASLPYVASATRAKPLLWVSGDRLYSSTDGVPRQKVSAKVIHRTAAAAEIAPIIHPARTSSFSRQISQPRRKIRTREQEAYRVFNVEILPETTVMDSCESGLRGRLGARTQSA